ncbi:hypothetical protein [Rufibacter roseus]|uniref:PH domain-containing protein n=1 Tax=Rufibacter roseus TaxID=1567108 RepID=A0ABW2DMP1_9BACT|nr:hypothetical protein [Rufibacter roseus]
MLAAFGAAPFYVFKKAIEEGKLELNVATVAAFVLLLLFLGGIAAIMKWAKVITIDKDRQLVTILHPFLLQKRMYNFNEILGFQWDYVSGKVTYKFLKLKASDGRTFQFLDFEMANFREVEGWIAQLFDLRVGKSWKLATPKQKAFEELRSKEFDIEQAEDIRWYLRFCIVGAVVSIIVHLYVLYERELSISTGSAIFLAIIFAFTVGVLIKYKEINRILNE